MTDGPGRPPCTLRLGVIGGLAGAVVMGLAAYAMPVPGTGGEPFFVAFATQMGFGSFSLLGGWALHLSIGMLIGAILGLVVVRVPRVGTGSLGGGIGIGLLAGVTAWAVLFIPAFLYFMPGLISAGAVLGGGFIANVVYGTVFGAVLVVGQLTYIMSGNRVKCEVCGASFSDLERLKGHAANVHLASDMQGSCLICHATFESQSELMHHMSWVHGNPPPMVIARFQGFSQK